MSSPNVFTRRGVLTAAAGTAGAITLSPLLAACGNDVGQYSKVAAGTEVTDAQTSVYHGKETVSYFQNAVSTWKKSGGDSLIAWYQKNIVDKGLS